MLNQPEFTLLYDGNCPICRKEVAWLRWKNTRHKLCFQDIHAADFDAARFDKTLTELMAEIHGIYPDGRLIQGMPVFRACYQAVGLGWLFAPTGWPLLRQSFDWLYALFARHRIRLGGRFGGNTCKAGVCKP
ncbi:MAG: DUF393 domain-containing protein [Methylomonas sp.]|jgi:predicted DCC family thiol-disulfide oxidoreductase YuxK|uniref:thiol-disulfide oxidoreductase DCC family protein n=1 Tax=Methylomonas sp. TaxID=418 RepID=UPI0025FE79A4|nr:DUF393 domain-containing protein [Methylomonas sp.]MCK9608584.1 DUF393 domain-containing protein [Methylomonas sp.]